MKNLFIVFLVFISLINAKTSIKNLIPPYDSVMMSLYDELYKAQGSEIFKKLKAILIRGRGENEKHKDYILAMLIIEEFAEFANSELDVEAFSYVLQILAQRSNSDVQFEKENNFRLAIKSNIYKLKIDKIKIKHLSFEGSKITKSSFNGVVLEDVDLTDIVMQDTTFKGSTFVQVNFRGALMKEATFVDSHFVSSAFSVTQMNDVTFDNSSFKNSNLIGAKIQNTNIINSNLKNINLSLANFDGVSFKNSIFDTVNLSGTVFKNFDGLNKAMLNNTFILKGEKQPNFTDYKGELNIKIVDKESL